MHLQWKHAMRHEQMTHNISVTMRDRVGYNGPPMGNHPLRIL